MSRKTDEHAAWLIDNPAWETSQAGSGSAAVYGPDETIELLRVRTTKQPSPGVSVIAPEPTDGVLLWIKKQ